MDTYTRVFPLVVASGESVVSFRLRGALPAGTRDFDEPALTIAHMEAHALHGEVFVELTVDQETYYLQENGLVEKAVVRHRLSKLLPVPDCKPGDRVDVLTEISSEDWRLESNRLPEGEEVTLSGECQLKLAYTVYENQPVVLFKGDDTSLEALAEKVEVESFCGEAGHTTDLSLPVEFAAPVKRTGEIQGKFINVKATALPGWIKVEGDVSATVAYEDLQGEKHLETFVTPLKFFVEYEEAAPHMFAEGSGLVELFSVRRDPESREGVLRGLVKSRVRLSRLESMTVLSDARGHHFTPHNPFLLEEVVGSGSSQTLIQREIVFSRRARSIRRPVDAQVRNLTTEVIANKVIVRGILQKQIYAVDAETGTLFAQEVTEPFVHFVDVPGAMPGARAHATARIEFVEVELRPGGETARQVTIIELVVKVTRFVKKDIVLPSPVKPPVKPGHHHHPGDHGRVYVVRSGDTVFKIARMFGVPMEAIIKANNLANPNLIFPGQTLIIPKV